MILKTITLVSTVWDVSNRVYWPRLPLPSWILWSKYNAEYTDWPYFTFFSGVRMPGEGLLFISEKCWDFPAVWINVFLGTNDFPVCMNKVENGLCHFILVWSTKTKLLFRHEKKFLYSWAKCSSFYSIDNSVIVRKLTGELLLDTVPFVFALEDVLKHCNYPLCHRIACTFLFRKVTLI